MSRISGIAGWMVGAAAWMAVFPAQAQSNLDAGKSPAQIFADTCNACHRSARELRQTNARFLLEHYTTGSQEAATMAAYLASVQQRRAPAIGAGQAATTTARRPPPAADQGRQAETQAALPATTPGRRAPANSEHSSPASTPAAIKPRRPSESLDVGTLPVDAMPGRDAEALSPQAAAAPTRPTGAEAFEE